MTRKWRVGILGLGHWYSCNGLARGLAEYAKADLVAVAYHDEDKTREFAATFGIDAHRDYDELLSRDDIDMVHIAPPVADIPQCTIKAAEAGKHMVMGKPMAMTVAEADAMVQSVEKSGVKCVPFQGIYRLYMADLKRRLDEGLIGSIAVMHATSRWSIAEDWFRSGQPGWFADPTQVPGGAFIDEGIYGIEQLRWLSDSKVVQVEAKMANLVHKDIGVEDWGMATFTFENGVIGTLEACWTINSPRKTGPSPKQNGVIRLEIIGTEGEVIQERLRVPGMSVLAAGAPNWVFERPMGEPNTPPSPGPLAHLIDCVESGREPVATIQEARRSFVVAMAAYEAARRGAPVRLD
jgi:predicted dehydrogenase